MGSSRRRSSKRDPDSWTPRSHTARVISVTLRPYRRTVISGRVCPSGQLAPTTVGQPKMGVAMPVVPASSDVAGHAPAGHGSASSSSCLLV